MRTIFQPLTPVTLSGEEPEIALTCKHCNDRAGHHLDAEAVKFEKLVDFAAGTLRAPVRGFLAVDQVRMDMEFTAVDTDVRIAGIARTNAPGTAETLREQLDRIVNDNIADVKFTLIFGDRFRPRHSEISWLKSAYVIAFAAFGYRYILDPALAIVRDQIREPDREVIRGFSTLVPGAPRNARILCLIEEPPIFRSIFVQMGRHVVFLPRLDDTNIYQRLESAGKVRATVKGTPLPWPNRPVFSLDLKSQ